MTNLLRTLCTKFCHNRWGFVDSISKTFWCLFGSQCIMSFSRQFSFLVTFFATVVYCHSVHVTLIQQYLLCPRNPSESSKAPQFECFDLPLILSVHCPSITSTHPDNSWPQLVCGWHRDLPSLPYVTQRLHGTSTQCWQLTKINYKARVYNTNTTIHVYTRMTAIRTSTAGWFAITISTSGLRTSLNSLSWS